MEMFHALTNFPVVADEIEYRFYQTKMYFDPDGYFLEKTHIHNAYEVYINVSGDLSFQVNGRIYSIKQGDVMVCRPKELHNCIYNGPTVHEYRCLWFNPQKGSELEKLFTSDDFQNKHSFDKAGIDYLERLFTSLYENPASKQKEIIFRILTFIILGSGEDIRAVSQLSRQMLMVLDYIDKNYMTVRSTAEIAEENYISVPTLNRIFKKQLHTTPTDFINSKRIKRAKELLEQGCSVTESSARSGFTNCSYFITLFKKYYGITPKKYRDRVRSGEIV